MIRYTRTVTVYRDTQGTSMFDLTFNFLASQARAVTTKNAAVIHEFHTEQSEEFNSEYLN